MAKTIDQPVERTVKTRNRPSVRPGGVIEPNQMWHLAKAMEATGLGAAAFRRARLNGLAVIYTGGRAFIDTNELIAYLKRQSTTPPVRPGK